VASSGCGCNSDPCQYSRVRDSFQIQCLTQLPAQPAPPTVTLCQAMQNPVVLPCPPCPTNPWVVLAKITLPGTSSTYITDSGIDGSVRTVILSTAVLQAQIYKCCCGQSTSPQGTLTVAQSASQIEGGMQVSVVVTNTTANLTANAVTVTIGLTAAFVSEEGTPSYSVNTGSQWVTAGGLNLTSLTSTAFPLTGGQAQTLTFQILLNPTYAEPAFTVTSVATATAAGFNTATNTTVVPLGEPGNAVSTH